METIYYFLIYILFINLIGFVTMFVDKKKAIMHKYRTPEKSIFMIALLGGALGVYIGMQKFRHKTKHLNFTVLIPVIILLNIICIVYIIIKINTLQ